MKYMSFNSSCSYTGLANMLLLNGVDTEDREIALEMQLPYLFAKEDGIYRSGPMLQGKKWFDLYLNPHGFELIEEIISRHDLPDALAGHSPAMLGLRINPNSKHAVIFTGIDRVSYHFINNRHPTSHEPDTLHYSRSELLARTDDQVHVASLKPTVPSLVSFEPLFEQSLCTLCEYRSELLALLPQYCSKEQLLFLMNTHFRALLLDTLTMMQLIQYESLIEQLNALQRKLLHAVKTSFSGPLHEIIPSDMLSTALDAYMNLITTQALSL